jgi:hypothetical protein
MDASIPFHELFLNTLPSLIKSPFDHVRAQKVDRLGQVKSLNASANIRQKGGSTRSIDPTMIKSQHKGNYLDESSIRPLWVWHLPGSPNK